MGQLSADSSSTETLYCLNSGVITRGISRTPPPPFPHCSAVTILYLQMKTNAWWEEWSASSNVSISLAGTTATVTKVTTLMTSCLTSVWILTSVWKADLIVTRALTLREGNKTSAAKLFYACIHDFFSLSTPSVSPPHPVSSRLTLSLSVYRPRYTYSNLEENN